MPVRLLIPHAETLPTSVYCLEGAATVEGNVLDLRFRLTGDLSRVILPQEHQALRRDGLWRTTCFEAFVGYGADAAYREFNCAPSSAWAAYDFDAYRTGMRDAPTTIMAWSHSRTPAELCLQIRFPLPISATRIGLSAVLEETDGTKSYWALRHPPGKPDFHHPDCFAMTLPAPEGP